MKQNNTQQSRSEPDPEFIAQQLRKPSGTFASKIGQKMNVVNEPLYDLMFDLMELEDNDQILEIGFGTGKFFKKLFEKNNTIQINGLDYSEKMVEAASEANHELISNGKLSLKFGNSDSMPFPDQTLDTVFCNMVVYFWDEPKKHLKEIRRVLKPRGQFYTGLRTHESMLLFPFVEHGFNLYSINEWNKNLDQNGFKIQATYKKIDPSLDLDSNELRLESCCIVAEK